MVVGPTVVGHTVRVVALLVLGLVLTGCGVGFHLVVSSEPVGSATGCDREEVQAQSLALSPVYR